MDNWHQLGAWFKHFFLLSKLHTNAWLICKPPKNHHKTHATKKMKTLEHANFHHPHHYWFGIEFWAYHPSLNIRCFLEFHTRLVIVLGPRSIFIGGTYITLYWNSYKLLWIVNFPRLRVPIGLEWVQGSCCLRSSQPGRALWCKCIDHTIYHEHACIPYQYWPTSQKSQI